MIAIDGNKCPRIFLDIAPTYRLHDSYAVDACQPEVDNPPAAQER